MFIETIKETAKSVFGGQKEVIVAYLYGSVLQGKEFKDIDVGILLDDRFDSPALYEAELAGEFEARLGGNFDIRVLNGRSVRFLFNVISHSVLLYCADEERRIKFEKRVMREYFDIRYYYDRYDRARRERYVTGRH